ncbi:MAG: hypothetical protein ACK41Z_05200 [Sediminibacterium sp.]
MNISILKGQKIFLVDAIGAIISVLSLLIPYAFEALFGMPRSTVRIFISIAIVCSIYSTTIYLTKIENWKPYLTIIALFNISYCIFTGYHIFKNLNTITLLGHLYFIAEILIILTLSIIELRLSRTTTNR